jgi:predicted ATPase
MIHSARFGNFKSLRKVQLDLKRLTVIVGPNGSGKTSILQGIDALSTAFLGDLATAGTVLQKSLSRNTDTGMSIECSSGQQLYRCEAAFTKSEDVDKLSRISCYFSESSTDVNWKDWGSSKPKSIHLPKSVLLRLDTAMLLNPRSADSDKMGSDGSGLHSSLASMALNDPDSWLSLQSDLQKIIPTIKRLRHTRMSRKSGAALLFDTVGAESISADQISEGTLLVLGLLTALYTTADTKLILFDDLDRGLHPKAQKDLIELLRRLLAADPKLQIIATTHSPYLLDNLEPDEVRMTVLGDKSATICAALSSHPDFEKWKDEMTPGEMWSLFGEKWLVDHGAHA